jgi:hypothetical protein
MAWPLCQGFYQRRVGFTASYFAFYISWPIPKHLHTEKHLVVAHLGMHLLCSVRQLPSMCSIFLHDLGPGWFLSRSGHRLVLIITSVCVCAFALFVCVSLVCLPLVFPGCVCTSSSCFLLMFPGVPRFSCFAFREE